MQKSQLLIGMVTADVYSRVSRDAKDRPMVWNRRSNRRPPVDIDSGYIPVKKSQHEKRQQDELLCCLLTQADPVTRTRILDSLL